MSDQEPDLNQTSASPDTAQADAATQPDGGTEASGDGEGQGPSGLDIYSRPDQWPGPEFTVGELWQVAGTDDRQDSLMEHETGPVDATGTVDPAVRARLAEPAERAEGFRRETRARRRRRLAYLLSLEVRRVVEDLALRQALLLKVWSKMRIRAPILNLLRSRFDRIRPDDLLLLPMECLDLLDQFFRQLDEFRLYVQVTEDMPTSLELVYEQQLQLLTKISRPLLGRLNAIHGYRGLGVELPIDSAVIEED